MDFPSIVSSLNLLPGRKVEARLCPDQFVGRVSEIEAAGAIVSRRPASCRPEGTGLLLILESPHIKEYEGQPAPAQGTTGRHIATFTRQVPGLEATAALPVVLVNAVQHQCSLGKPTGYCRDRVFIAAWFNGGKADFVARLKALYRAGDLVVCGCTKGNGSTPTNQLRQLVHQAIQEAIPGALVLRRTHPSGWNIRQNRVYEWHAV